MSVAFDPISHAAEAGHAAWSFFAADEQRAMRRDDLIAGKSVAGVLLAVIGIGLAAMILTVVACW